jgi:cell wall-associated NlpC family hydrolase
VSDLSLGDILRRKSIRGAWLEAALPDGRAGFVEREAVEPYQAWQSSRRATPETIETAARMFVGVPYLWGGTSARGFDCSGFVKTVFMLNGLALLRDAGQQARAGRDVDPGQNFANLRRGDLLFFGRRETAEKPERIWHVAIYLRDRNFIHCSGRVRISSLDPASPQYDEGHASNFVRARRLIGASPP